MSLFYIASLKHTGKGHEHIQWWQKNECGYTPVLGDYVGHYSEEQALQLNDGRDCLAVPVEIVDILAQPEPHLVRRPSVRFYDQRGPVLNNTRANWNLLIAASLATGRHHVPRPAPFRQRRESTSWEDTACAS